MGACTTIRVAIIADTHGFIDPRIAEAVRACDVAVHAGDIGNAEWRPGPCAGLHHPGPQRLRPMAQRPR